MPTKLQEQDGTTSDGDLTFTGAYVAQVINLTAGKITKRIAFTDLNETCYIAIPQLIQQSTKHDACTYKTAYVAGAVSGNLIAGVANKVIKVHQIKIQALATMEANILDDAAGNVLDHFKGNDREGDESPNLPYPQYLYKTQVGKPLYVAFITGGNTTFRISYSDADAV
jgi:hypothetical protein